MARGVIGASNLTAHRLRALYDFDSEVGIFVRRRSPRSKVGSANSGGYLSIFVDGRLYLAHRLAWLYVYGEWPIDKLDHINGDRADNRIANLRQATSQQNAANRRKHKNNTSGFKGVRPTRFGIGWEATICVNYVKTQLGTFGCPTAAHFAYVAASRQHNGKFARPS